MECFGVTVEWMFIATWGLALLSFVGSVFNAKRSKIGFYIWIVANLAWVIIDFSFGIYAQSVLYLAFTYISIKGLINWTREEKEIKELKRKQELMEREESQTIEDRESN